MPSTLPLTGDTRRSETNYIHSFTNLLRSHRKEIEFTNYFFGSKGFSPSRSGRTFKKVSVQMKYHVQPMFCGSKRVLWVPNVLAHCCSIRASKMFHSVQITPWFNTFRSRSARLAKTLLNRKCISTRYDFERKLWLGQEKVYFRLVGFP